MKTSQLYQQHSEVIHNYIMKFVCESDAGDLTQEIFIKVNNNIDKFRGESSIKTWIYRIATNTVKDYLKSKDHKVRSGSQQAISEEQLSLLEVPQFEKESPESISISDEMNECIREFIHRLPYSYSTILVLSELEGYKIKEISDIMSVAINTVKVRLYRARARLKNELEAGCLISISCDDRMKCERREI